MYKNVLLFEKLIFNISNKYFKMILCKQVDEKLRDNMKLEVENVET